MNVTRLLPLFLGLIGLAAPAPASAQDPNRSAASVQAVAFSPDGARVLSGSRDKTMKLWEVATGRVLLTFTGHSGGINSVAFSPDGTHVLSGSDDKTMKLWEVATGRILRTFSGHSGPITSVVFSPDGTRALSSNDDEIKLWDVATGSALPTFEKLQFAGGYSAAFSPDGTRVLSSGHSGYTMQLLDGATGQVLQRFEPDDSLILSVAFSPDGHRVLSGDYDKNVRLWDVATGRILRTFTGHSDRINSVAFSPDGTRVLSGSEDKTMKLWDAASGQPLRTFAGHSYVINSVAFSPDGARLLSGSNDGTMRLWDAATGQIAHIFGKAVTGCSLVNEGGWKFQTRIPNDRGWLIEKSIANFVVGDTVRINLETSGPSLASSWWALLAGDKTVVARPSNISKAQIKYTVTGRHDDTTLILKTWIHYFSVGSARATCMLASTAKP